MTVSAPSTVNTSACVNSTMFCSVDVPVEGNTTIWENSTEGNLKSKTDEYSNEELTFCEGAKLLGKGFCNKAKNLLTSIVKHPVKTMAIAAGTAASLSLLPLIGISSATGAAVLTLGFAGYSIVKTGAHVLETIKDSNEGRNDEVREDLETIGGDCLDLALSVPFVPKAFKQLSRTLKYGSKIGLNMELVDDIKNANGILGKFTELLKGDVKN